MKRTLGLMVALALARTACADEWAIQWFWSTTGINNPDYVYYPGPTNFLPYFVPPTPVSVLPAGAYDLFLWGKVTDPNNLFYYHPEGVLIYGLDLSFGGNATHGVNVAYRHCWPDGHPSHCRWGGGSQGIPLDGVMAAVTGRGIMLVPYWIPDLYRYEYVDFLLGAARITGDPGEFKTIGLDAADGLGIAARDLLTGEDVPDPPNLPALVTFVARGDLNCDGGVGFDDINPFVLALSNPGAYYLLYPTCNILTGDCDFDGDVDFDDINPFVALLGGG